MRPDVTFLLSVTLGGDVVFGSRIQAGSEITLWIVAY